MSVLDVPNTDITSKRSTEGGWYVDFVFMFGGGAAELEPAGVTNRVPMGASASGGLVALRPARRNSGAAVLVGRRSSSIRCLSSNPSTAGRAEYPGRAAP